MKVRNMVLCALFAALMVICAWIAVPVLDIAFTLQTFAVFLTLGVLGGRRGSVVCLVYLLLGAVGLPVFAGFRGGIGTLLGVTGGYIWGFLATALVYWAVTALLGDGLWCRALGMVLGLLVCYGCGSVWFVFMYAQSGSAIGIGAVLAKCVLPYLLPDGVKLALALSMAQRLRRVIMTPPRA